MNSDTCSTAEPSLSEAKENPRIGLDFGGVIVNRAVKRPIEEHSFPDTPASFMSPMPGVFGGVNDLVDLFKGQVWIISTAGDRMQRLTHQWLYESGFHQKTNFDPSHLRFCLERSEKKFHCEEFGITHFVDDRMHLMQILKGTVDNLFLFVSAQGKKQSPKYVVEISDWNQGYEAILKSLVEPKIAQ